MIQGDSTAETHAIVMVDVAGVIRVWSAGAEKIFGYDAEEAIGQTLDLIVPEEYRERHWAGFAAAVERRSSKLDQPAANIPVLRGDGTVVRFAGRLIFLKDARGEAVGAMGIFAPNIEGRSGEPGLPDM